MADIISIGAEELYTEHSTARHNLGQLAIDKYGNRYRYVKAGAVDLVTGNLLQEPAEDTQFDNMAVAANVAIGETDVTVTNGTTTITAGMFDNGIFHVSYGTGIGQLFRIKNHTTGTSGATITYTLNRPLKIALTAASSKVSVRKNPYNGILQYPATTQTGAAVGIALYAMTATYYGWIQSGGDCAVLFDTGTNTSTGVTGLSPSAAVAGSVKPQGGGAGAIIIGYARDVASTDSYMGIAHLMIDHGF